jgi:hypothetical protein
MNTQNDLENTGGTYGSPTARAASTTRRASRRTPTRSQFKIRGFITDNTLRDGFLRLTGVDGLGQHRPHRGRLRAERPPLRHGQLRRRRRLPPKAAEDTQQGVVPLSAGSYDFERASWT